MSAVIVRAASRIAVERGGEYELDIERTVPTVEILVEGIIFHTDCVTDAAARALVSRVVRALTLVKAE